MDENVESNDFRCFTYFDFRLHLWQKADLVMEMEEDLFQMKRGYG